MPRYPGAGPVLTKADVQAFRGKFSTVVDRAAALVRAGVAKDQLLMQIRTDDIGWALRIPQVDGFVAELGRGPAERPDHGPPEAASHVVSATQS